MFYIIKAMVAEIAPFQGTLCGKRINTVNLSFAYVTITDSEGKVIKEPHPETVDDELLDDIFTLEFPEEKDFQVSGFFIKPLAVGNCVQIMMIRQGDNPTWYGTFNGSPELPYEYKPLSEECERTRLVEFLQNL